LTLLPDIPAIYPIWKQLVRDHGVQGVKVYDAGMLRRTSARTPTWQP